jgi:putative endopeptidase
VSRPSVIFNSALLLVLAAGCDGPPPKTPPPPDPPGEKKTEVTGKLDDQGLSAAALDRTVRPCDDFYAFACGGWEKATQIPDDRSRWMRSFSEIDQRNEADLKTILENAAKTPDDPGATGRLGRFYKACMDEAAIEKAGLKPIEPLLAVARSATDRKSLTKALATLHKHGVWAVFDVTAGQDYKDATKMIGMMDQNGLGMPDRDYYLKDDPDKKELRQKYVAHVERMLKLGGHGSPKKGAADVMKIETELARASKSREERRDPAKMYNKVDRAGLERVAPAIDWKQYFEVLGSPGITDISVTSPTFFADSSKLLAEAKPEVVQSYLVWQVLRATAPTLGKKLEQEAFSFTQAVTGQKVNRDRWKRCIDATDSALGELLAQPFVELRFGGGSKAAAESYVHAIAAAMRERLAGLEWMDQPTRAAARQKLDAMAYLIGYPAKYKTYDFAITQSYAENALAGESFKIKDQLAKVGKPVDRGEWYMTPPTVNAYYDPQKNQMVFPAGILQPPFYSAKASVPVNLGAMGMVVGHELTHGFDDEGSQFDHSGNLANWWSPSVRSTFETRGSCIEKQYEGYEVMPGVRMKGKLTLGENIADAGGIKLAFAAYRALRADSAETVVADGFTEDQQFFLSTAQIWCAKMRDETTRLMAETDPHAHPKYRVNGPLSMLPEFAEAFQCTPGSKMVANEKCTVW